MCADLRECAILDAGGEVLAQSSSNAWGEQVSHLWEAADGSGGERVEQIHVATEVGELFAARSERFAAVALTDRFALGSLMFCDLRAVLRELETETGNGPAETQAG